MDGDGRELLAGVRVLDLTDAYGAFAARVLGDLGAEIVRIEPGDGGRGRTRGPRGPDGTSLHHLHRNVNKTIVRSGDSRVIDGLLAGADIAFCSDGAAGDDPAAIASRHPHLVVVSVSPYGIAGPTAQWGATELVAQSLAGVVYRSGVPKLPPVSAPGSYCEDVGAVVAALAALLALYQVRDGGQGQLLDVSTILALAQCTDMSLALWSALRFEHPRSGAGLYPLFDCTDGLARLVLPMAPADWRSLIVWLGSPPEWTGPDWERPMLGPDEREQIMARLPERFAAGTRAQLAAAGDAAGLRITPVLTPSEVLSNEHVKARESFTRLGIGDATGSVPSRLFGVNGRRSGVAPPRITRQAPAWASKPPPTGQAAGKALPLKGIRVLEVGTGVAAPEAGRVLGEWGADVIKVETRSRPDFQRMVMGGVMNPAFATVARNKRLLAADLGTPAGRDLVHRLLPQIDVIVENNATGVIDRLGLGWETVAAINPRIVMVSSQLYGDRGPWALKKGYGPSARAIGGLTWLWAHGPREPRGVMTIHPDHLAGRLVALGALAGLLAREQTGTGTRLDLAQFEAVSTLLGDLLLAESLVPGAAQPVGNRSAEHAPWNVFRCADADADIERWLAVCVTDDATWSALLTVAPAALDRPDWQLEAARLASADRIEAAIAEWLRGQDVTRTETLLQQAGVPAGEVLFPRSQAEHVHFVGRGYPVRVEQPGIGPVLFEGPAFTAPRMGEPRCGPAPLPGQHTAEICQELLGLGDAEIAQLVENGALDPLPEATA